MYVFYYGSIKVLLFGIDLKFEVNCQINEIKYVFFEISYLMI